MKAIADVCSRRDVGRLSHAGVGSAIMHRCHSAYLSLKVGIFLRLYASQDVDEIRICVEPSLRIDDARRVGLQRVSEHFDHRREFQRIAAPVQVVLPLPHDALTHAAGIVGGDDSSTNAARVTRSHAAL